MAAGHHDNRAVGDWFRPFATFFVDGVAPATPGLPRLAAAPENSPRRGVTAPPDRARNQAGRHGVP